MRDRLLPAGLQPWLELVRWHKPTGRLILLIPAGWALWMSPSAPPSLSLVSQIGIGGLAVSAAGCIANDLWDQKIDAQVERTVQRPLARKAIRPAAAVRLLLFLSSRVCQLADPSLTPSLKGLRLDGLSPRPRGRANFDDQHLPILRQAWPSESSRPRLRKTRRF